MFHDTASSSFPNANRTLGGTGSGATDFASGHPAVDHKLAEHIPQVARTAAQGCLDSVLQAELQHAPREKPSVPQDVDRSLPQDPATASGDADHVRSASSRPRTSRRWRPSTCSEPGTALGND
jgi:hypothetical protein